MRSFCRACLVKISDTSSSAPLDRESYKHQSMFCVPEMNLRVLPDAKLCKDCVAALDLIYKFKIKCRRAEDKINQRQFDVAERLTVKQETSSDNTIRTFCRICVEDVIDHSFHLAERPFYKSKLMFCVPEMNLQLTFDIKLCSDCRTVLDKIYAFKTKCLDVEKNIKEYLKLYDKVDFRNLSVWYNAFVKYSGLENFTIKQEEIDLDDKVEIMEDVRKQIINDKISSLKTEECNNRRCDNVKRLLPDATKNISECSKYDHSIVQNSKLPERYVDLHTSEKPFKCSLCEYSTKQKSNLKKHIRTHTTVEKQFKCSLCEYSTAQKYALEMHFRTHTGEKPFKCSLCEYSAAQKCALEIHFRKHTGEKPFKCSLCDYGAAQKYALGMHFRTHTGEKPFKCSLCKYSAAQKCALEIHVRKHTGEKPFKCSLCEYSSKEKPNLKRHIRKHTGEKPFECSLCEYSAAQKSSLKSHIHRHTSEKPHKCSLCEFRATDRSALRKHICTPTD